MIGVVYRYGQLSGMVEPVAGILGTAAVVVSSMKLLWTPSAPPNISILFIVLQLVEPLLPYALAFAAGAMVFVVVDDIIPESYSL